MNFKKTLGKKLVKNLEVVFFPANDMHKQFT